ELPEAAKLGRRLHLDEIAPCQQVPRHLLQSSGLERNDEAAVRELLDRLLRVEQVFARIRRRLALEAPAHGERLFLKYAEAPRGVIGQGEALLPGETFREHLGTNDVAQGVVAEAACVLARGDEIVPVADEEAVRMHDVAALSLLVAIEVGDANLAASLYGAA